MGDAWGGGGGWTLQRTSSCLPDLSPPCPSPPSRPPPQVYAPSVAPSLIQAWRFFSLERQLLHLLLPAFFDLAGSALLNVGLVFVSASATQMLRQSLLLFATAVAVAAYKKPLNRLHFVGLVGCLVRPRRLGGGVGWGGVEALGQMRWLVLSFANFLLKPIYCDNHCLRAAWAWSWRPASPAALAGGGTRQRRRQRRDRGSLEVAAAAAAQASTC